MLISMSRKLNIPTGDFGFVYTFHATLQTAVSACCCWRSIEIDFFFVAVIWHGSFVFFFQLCSPFSIVWLNKIVLNFASKRKLCCVGRCVTLFDTIIYINYYVYLCTGNWVIGLAFSPIHCGSTPNQLQPRNNRVFEMYCVNASDCF